MSGTGKQTGQMSRWGGFLQQAVASVESKLDTILAEEDTPASKGNTAPSEKPSGRASASPQPRSDQSRSSSSARVNDRLQERLAKAVARSNSPKPTDSVGTPSGPVSRADTPSGEKEDNVRSSIDSIQRPTDAIASPALPPQQPDTEAEEKEYVDITLPQNKPQQAPAIVVSEPFTIESATSSLPSSSAKPSIDLPRAEQPEQSSDDVIDTSETTENETIPTQEHKALLTKLQAEHEEAEKKWQEELHGYGERMDAMQAKLLYLTKESAAASKDAAASAPAGSLEKKLLERDEKIALLMEEGQKLSKTEFTHMTTIKKFRAQAVDAQKVQKDLRAQIEKAEKEKQLALDRVRRAEAAARRAEEKAANSSKSDKDMEALVKERNALNATVADIKSQLARALSRAELAESKAQTDALEREKRQVAELKDDLSSQKIENELREDKLRREIRDLKENLEKEKGISRALENQLRGEQSVMERKMESLRSQAEEVSSSGDSQAKLLRQIETLQTQYAVASENWQGIESSLLTRLANMEKERDDVLSRESDLRRKAREAGLKAKKLESETGKTRDEIDDLQRTLSDRQSEMDKLVRKMNQAMEEMTDAKKDYEKQLRAQETAFAQKLEDEKAKWREQSPSAHALRPESPVFRKNSNQELAHLSIAPSERAPSRRSSVFPSQVFEMSAPTRQNSSSSIGRIYHSGQNLETPSIQSFDRDEFFSGPATPMSPNGVNDLISVSTVGAGPSVQLVERMSANVRRLESERAASKDEMVRLTSQRDEARQEVVRLMREVEQKRAADERIKVLEEESKSLNDRYQTTLEMLGEKSEMVEELRADVADLKKIYRELVDSTMKG